ncbi:MAG: ComEC/Rec2 family competence protein, partial [Bowdeniella nasicola]|nr:ComEC/Rec2 family competence protein [Bowdeniella nasicola]
MRHTLDLRLVPLAGATWGGTAVTLTFGPWVVIAAIMMLTVWWIRPLRGAHAVRSAAILTVIFGLAGALTVTTAGEYGRGEEIRNAAKQGRYATITAVVRSDARAVAHQFDPTNPHSFLEVEARKVCVRGQCYSSRERVMVFGPVDQYRTGMRIETRGVLSMDQRAANRKVIQHATTTRLLAPPRHLAAITDTIRQSFRAITKTLAQPASGLLLGITLGDRSHISEQLAADFQATSLTHLTAISGAHTAVILTAVLTLTSIFPRFVATACALVTLAGLFLLVGPLASVTRAVVMAGVIVLARSMGRPGHAMAALATAVTVIVLVWPQTSISLGFRLSVVATAALIAFTPLTTRVLA